MKSLGRSILIPGACVIGLLYLAGDLFFFHGPLADWVEASGLSGERGESAVVVAKVSGSSITLGQLDRAVGEQLWLDGRERNSLSAKDLHAMRLLVLDDLIDRELLRGKAGAERVTGDEMDARMKVFSSRFDSSGEMEQAMKSQGIGSMRDLRNRIAARIQQEKHILSRIGSSVRVNDGEAREWYVKHCKALENPERIEVRHVFLATLERPEAEAKAALDKALADLSAKKRDFPTLAKELSEDNASKERGGELGWMSRSRVAADFSVAVFELPLHQPSLIRTKIGWHLVEVTAKKPAEPRSFEDARKEIISALESEKISQMADQYRRELRAAEYGNIKTFPDRIPH